MRIVLASDLHVHNWPDFSRSEGGLPSRLANCVNVLEDIRLYCGTHAIGVVVLGGDIFHKRGVVFTQPYNLVVAVLARMKEDGITVLAVDGNHDHANKTGTIHTLQALEAAGLVACVSVKDGWINWSLETDDDALVVSGFSYCDSRQVFEQRLEESAADYKRHYKGTQRIGVFHHGFTGARVGTALEYVVKEDVDPGILDGHAFAYIFSGHYHARQTIGGLSHATYIGSPLEHVRGEDGQDKGFLVYDTSTCAFDLVKLDRPRFVKLTQTMLDTVDPFEWPVSGNYVDVHYEELPVSWEETEKFLWRLGASGVRPVPLASKHAPKTARLAVDPTLDTKTVLTRYVEHRKEDTKGIDPAELLRLGLDLFDRAQE